MKKVFFCFFLFFVFVSKFSASKALQSCTRAIKLYMQWIRTYVLPCFCLLTANLSPWFFAFLVHSTSFFPYPLWYELCHWLGAYYEEYINDDRRFYVLVTATVFACSVDSKQKENTCCTLRASLSGTFFQGRKEGCRKPVLGLCGCCSPLTVTLPQQDFVLTCNYSENWGMTV